MKPVLLNKRKYNWKDILRAISILIVYYLVFTAWAFLFVYWRKLTNNESLAFHINENNWWIIYIILIAPAISGITHIWYSETGNISLRAILWFHIITIVFMAPTAAFLFT